MKAFDRVDRQKLWTIGLLQKTGVLQHSIGFIKGIYDGTTVCIAGN